MKTVFILPGINGTFEIVDCYQAKNGSYTHNEGVVLDGFESKKTAEMYCDEFDYAIKN